MFSRKWWNAATKLESDSDIWCSHCVTTAESLRVSLPQRWWKSPTSVGRINSQNAIVVMAGTHDRKALDIFLAFFLCSWSAAAPVKNMDNLMLLFCAASSKDFSRSSRALLWALIREASTARTSASTRHREQKSGPAHMKTISPMVNVDSTILSLKV